MDILNKAQELADALEKSDELRNLREAEKTMQSDKQAMKLMNDFRVKQLEVYNMQVAGEEPSDQLTEELDQLREKLQENLFIMDYLSAQEKVGKILEQINNIISQVLHGDSCNGNSCASCSGCN
ncbi:YlbF family regulator [Candidatus Formimonas warabiya]|uniref:YlbF family regulator n=1 Tax=Formimonas warabiya TaxID=1761012 RepID=A0A3G1KP85_FORW1|nr:YlbF family regulator [Candidatus Formimonas warabiya]ATW24246.1 hypothetical protein DCMF_05100 [Candidatus Formimonas warabiya]